MQSAVARVAGRTPRSPPPARRRSPGRARRRRASSAAARARRRPARRSAPASRRRPGSLRRAAGRGRGRRRGRRAAQRAKRSRGRSRRRRQRLRHSCLCRSILASAGITRIRSRRSVASLPPSQPRGLPCPTDATPTQGADNRRVSLAPPEGDGPLRRERLRTARLYFCCEARPGGEDPEPLLRAALNGGVDIVQLREKSLPRREVELSALTFRRLCDTYSALFIVNDDPDLARACDADGVHVGQDDMAAAEAREIARPGRDRRPLDPLRGADRGRGRRSRSTTSASDRSGRRQPSRAARRSAST